VLSLVNEAILVWAKNSNGTTLRTFLNFNLLHGRCMLLPFPSTPTSLCAPANSNNLQSGNCRYTWARSASFLVTNVKVQFTKCNTLQSGKGRYSCDGLASFVATNYIRKSAIHTVQVVNKFLSAQLHQYIVTRQGVCNHRTRLLDSPKLSFYSVGQ